MFSETKIILIKPRGKLDGNAKRDNYTRSTKHKVSAAWSMVFFLRNKVSFVGGAGVRGGGGAIICLPWYFEICHGKK